MKKLYKAIIFCFCTALMLCSGIVIGCGGKDYNTINITEVTHSIFYAPFYAAQNLGYFEDEGLKINLTNGGGSDVCMTSLISGGSDIILAGPETVVYASERGYKDQPKVFGQLTQTDGSFIITRDPNITAENFDITDLVGETIIGGRAGGLPAMTLEYIIEKEYEIGTDSDQVNLRTDVAFNNISSAFFEDESVKFCTLFEPTATNFVAEHSEFKIVGSVADLLEENEVIPYTCFIAKDSYLKEHSDIAEKFLRAVVKAADYLKNAVETNQLDKVVPALKNSFDSMTDDDLKVSAKQYYSISAWTENPTMTKSSLSKLIEICSGAGMTNGESDYDKIIDTTIAKKVMDSLKG